MTEADRISVIQSSPVQANGIDDVEKNTNDNANTNQNSFINKNMGLLLLIIGQMFFASMALFVKLLHNVDPPVGTLELVVVRMAITGVLSQLYLLVAKVPDPFLGPKGVRKLLFFRGTVGFIAIVALYKSIQFLNLTDVTTIGFLLPCATGFLGHLILNEPYTSVEKLSSIVSLIGVLLIARPPFLFGRNSFGLNILNIDNDDLITGFENVIGVILVLVNVLGAALAYISTRHIGKRAHPMHVITYFSWCSVIFGSLLMLCERQTFVIPKNTKWSMLLIAIGVCGFLGQILLTLGLRRERVGRSSTAMYVQIIFALIFEKVFFDTTPRKLSIFGSLIIITMTLIVALSKERKTKEVKSTEDETNSLLRDERERMNRRVENYGSLQSRS